MALNVILNLPSINKAPGFDKIPGRILKDSLPATLHNYNQVSDE